MPWWAQLLGILGIVTGGMAAIVRTLWRVDPREHPWRTCKCPRCAQKRRLLVQSIEINEHRKIMEHRHRLQDEGVHFTSLDEVWVDEGWIRTVDLRPGMTVQFKHTSYAVIRAVSDQYGYMLQLRNLDTKVKFGMVVGFDICRMKIWKPILGMGR